MLAPNTAGLAGEIQGDTAQLGEQPTILQSLSEFCCSAPLREQSLPFPRFRGKAVRNWIF